MPPNRSRKTGAKDGGGATETPERGAGGRKKLPKHEKRENPIQFKARDDEFLLLSKVAKMDRLEVGVWARNMSLICAEYRACGLDTTVAFTNALEYIGAKNPALYQRIVSELEKLRNSFLHSKG